VACIACSGSSSHGKCACRIEIGCHAALHPGGNITIHSLNILCCKAGKHATPPEVYTPQYTSRYLYVACHPVKAVASLDGYNKQDCKSIKLRQVVEL
jgi:hypothetical protein